MSESDNIDLITRFCASWTDPDIAEILDYFTDDAVYHNMPIQPVQGKDAIKGMILSCVLSDTLEFRSPTTTDVDVDLAEFLAGELDIDIAAYAAEMFAATSSLRGLIARQARREHAEDDPT